MAAKHKPFIGNVKAVLSGDSLLLAHPNDPAIERLFSLAYVSAPRLSRDDDEPFAFQSREYLRNLALGKTIKCNVLYKVPASGKEYGSAVIKDGPDLPDQLVKDGWVKIRDEAGKKEDSPEVMEKLDALRALEAQAKEGKKGIWAGTGGKIEVLHDLSTAGFLEKWKGRTVQGIIERVLAGDRILMRLFLAEDQHLQIMTLIAGVRAPSTERIAADNEKVPAEEYANEAKKFVEQRLLQTQVSARMVGASAQGALVAIIIHPRGNIAELLLGEGLARCFDHHATMVGFEEMKLLREAERKAALARLRLHKNRVVKEGEGDSFDATVSHIISADTILVRKRTGDDKEYRIQLSSIRGPRASDDVESKWREEAKECARKKLIGKHVRVTIEGHREAEGDFKARDVATILQHGKNVGLQLVQEGMVSVIRHRKGDTDRASNYDELLIAQDKAKDEKKGIWSGTKPRPRTCTDLTDSAQNAKVQSTVLARQRKVAGIVDYCKSGSRFTVLVPSHSIKITLVLCGIRGPRAPGRNSADEGDPFGKEALDLAYKRLNQRDVEIDIYGMDKTAGMIGELWINRENFAKILVEEGLAKVYHHTAEKTSSYTELCQAEKRAKLANKCLWRDWTPSDDDENEDVSAEALASKRSGAGASGADKDNTPTIDKKPADYRDIVVTNIEPNGKLKIQEVGKGTSALETMMSEFKKFHMDTKNNVAIKENPKVGDLVAARYSADGQWYRARIRSNDRPAQVAEVVYIDYGNSERHPWAKLRPLDQAQFSPQKLKPQAVDAVLSFVQLPQSADYLNEALTHLAEITEGKRLVGSYDFIDAKDNNLNYITIFDPSSTGTGTDANTKDEGGSSGNAGGSGSGSGPGVHDTINRDMIQNGQAMVPRKLKNWERSQVFVPTLAKLREAEAEAKQDRVGIWEYGDITED